MSKKTIWITGGSTGIGKALAIKFASKGWNVAVSARRAELLNELSNSYENISGFSLDVTNKEKCKEVFNEIKNKFENIDICFFSTGTWVPKKFTLKTSSICSTSISFSFFGSHVPVEKKQISIFSYLFLISLNTSLHFSLSVTSKGKPEIFS